MNLEDIRERIDVLDDQVIDLLKQRMRLAYFTKRFKSSIQDVNRETEMFQRLKGKKGILTDSDLIEDLFKRILQQSRENQKENFLTIGYWGNIDEECENILSEQIGKGVIISFKTTRILFDNIRDHKLNYGVIPSRKGTPQMDLTIKEWLMTSGLFISKILYLKNDDLDYNLFYVVQRDKKISGKKNCSICFSIVDKVGTLYEMVKVMHKYSFNIKNIESIPFQKDSRMFFVDFSHSVSELVFSKAMDDIKNVSIGYKLLGAYDIVEI